MPSAHVAVIGGGLAGLAAAVRLVEKGIRVSLVERHPRLGGRATSYLLPNGETIDNCQHVTMKCCTNLEDFYRRIGVADKIRYYDRLVFADSTGRHGEIRSWPLPAPFHVAPSFLVLPLLQWKDKIAIAQAMMQIVRSRGRPRLEAGMTMLQWLERNGQTSNAIERFWRVVLVSALNEQLDRTDAQYGIDVFWKAFLSSRDLFGIGVPTVPLESLYASAADRIQRAGGEVRTRCGATELLVGDGAVAGVRLDDGSVLQTDHYISAIPFDRLSKLIPVGILETDISKLKVSPITSVHLWFDRSVIREPFVTSLDQTIQWVFNKQSGEYLQIVISASHALIDQSQQEILAMCTKELGELIPATRDAKVVRSVVVRENAATFSPEPGCDQWRPATTTCLSNFFLAGDWTRTGWPATMESAVISGYRAAEAILTVRRPAGGENVSDSIGPGPQAAP